MGFFKDHDPEKIDKWACILERGTDYEVAMAKNYLSNLNIPSNILSKRDSSYSLNFGDTSMVYLYVPVEYEAAARKALEELENLPDTDTDDNDGYDGNGHDDDFGDVDPDDPSQKSGPQNRKIPPSEVDPADGENQEER